MQRQKATAAQVTEAITFLTIPIPPTTSAELNEIISNSKLNFGPWTLVLYEPENNEEEEPSLSLLTSDFRHAMFQCPMTGGTIWDYIAREYLKSLSVQVSEGIGFDSEGDMFCIYTKLSNWNAMLNTWLKLHELFTSSQLLRPYIIAADAIFYRDCFDEYSD